MSATAEGAWAAEADALLRGLAHALSNRVAALTLASEEFGVSDADVVAEARARVDEEVARLREVDRLLKLLPADGRARRDPLLPAEVLADAVALHAHHLELRDVPIVIEASGEPTPVRVVRSTLLRTFCVLLSAARRASGGGAVTARLQASADEVRFECVPHGDAYGAAALATVIGGEMDGATLVLPSLAALRASEGPGDG